MKQKLSIQEIIRREKRRQALGTEIMCDWDFAHDNMENPELTRYARNYVKYFPRFRAQGAGLLLYGGPGSGKSYAAAEIVNALTDQGYRCLFTSLLSILSELATAGATICPRSATGTCWRWTILPRKRRTATPTTSCCRSSTPAA